MVLSLHSKFGKRKYFSGSVCGKKQVHAPFHFIIKELKKGEKVKSGHFEDFKDFRFSFPKKRECQVGAIWKRGKFRKASSHALRCRNLSLISLEKKIPILSCARTVHEHGERSSSLGKKAAGKEKGKEKSCSKKVAFGTGQKERGAKLSLSLWTKAQKRV